jgi:hypothetical protein
MAHKKQTAKTYIKIARKQFNTASEQIERKNVREEMPFSLPPFTSITYAFTPLLGL